MIRTLATREIYRNRWMRLREDDVEFPNGARGIYGVVEKPDFVAVVPVDAEGRIHLVQQYRYPVAGRFWEVPQGAWEDSPDADPEALARGELAEETGLRAETMIRAGQFFQSYGYSTQICHLFVARDLTPGPTALEETESDLISASFAPAELRAMLAGGEIRDQTTLAAFGALLVRPEFATLLG
ncbi:NUDIX domain-containing protein [Acidimangrovimonas sediminis]|uniref:NUDIX domain-containing protein n=1 Tax=Acidimangrovimonas sediminis TaxID=2056283 RepID=UPI0018EBED2F|nr:NUDIX hydrolase [Acidimangrovimonas sediminis]